MPRPGSDFRAFAALVDMYYARCLRFALHMLANRSDAEEAVQDTFVRVYRALPSYVEQEAFEPWLFRILANRCRSAGSRERRRAEFVEFGEVPDRPSEQRCTVALNRGAGRSRWRSRAPSNSARRS
jgi:RNA polymerase sigma-70 factor (ECF subfamily)